jgi:hypothetical protein
MIAIVVAVALIVLGALGRSLLTEEIRGRLDRLPGWLLRQAARQLDLEQQAIYDELWLPDLEYILRDTEGRPITRLLTGIKFAIGLLVSTWHEARQSQRAAIQATPNEICDSAQPELVAAEPKAALADPPHRGIRVIRPEPMQPAALFSLYSDYRHDPYASRSGPRTGGAVPTTVNNRGGWYDRSSRAGAAPTTEVYGSGSYGPSPEEAEYVRTMLDQMGAEVRDRMFGGSSVVGHLYHS